MAKPHQRVFAFTLALLFLFSTVALSAFVIYQVVQDRDDSSISGNFDDSGGTSDSSPNVNVQEDGVLKGSTLDNFEPINTVEELQFVELKEGDGEEVQPGATVTAHYTGAFAANGLIFESSKDGGQPIQFGLEQVIAGWQQGVPGMKVGGTRRLIIPANLAYGPAPEGYEPNLDGRPLGPLVFDIELTDVQNP